jgi:threonine aldolase
VETNIIFFEIRDPKQSAVDVVSALKREGLLLNAVSRTRLRALTHLDITSHDIEQAGAILTRVLG